MTSRFLITETVEDIQVLKEDNATTGQKDYFIQGVFLEANRKNRNGRIYPLELLQREVAKYTATYINQNRSLGELGHPDSPQINLDRASHLILELKQDSDNFIGKAKILDTPYGKIAKSLLEENIKLGVSSRGLGSLQARNGVDFVQGDYTLITAGDIVADPSAPGAFVKGIMEGVEWIQEKDQWLPLIKPAKKAYNSAHKIDREAMNLRIFEHFMRKL